MKRLWLLLVVVGNLSTVRAAEEVPRLSEMESNRVSGADVKLTRDFKIAGHAASFHKATSRTLQVRESEDCDWRKVSDTEIQIGRRCDFLSGTFTYLFVPRSNDSVHRIVIDFTASHPTSDGKIFIVGAPIEVLEK